MIPFKNFILRKKITRPIRQELKTYLKTVNASIYALFLPLLLLLFSCSSNEGNTPQPTLQYTITFESQGGSAVASLKVTQGQKANKPADPTRAGYTFVGWYKEAAGTNEFKFGTETITGDITLFAKWIENAPADLLSLTLTLGGNSVIGEIEDTTVRFSVADKTLTTATIASITLSAQATSEAVVGGTLTFTSATSDLTVTASDGKTTKTYTLKLVSNQAQLTNLSLTIAEAIYPVVFPEGQTTTSLAVPDDTIASATIESITVSAEATANLAEGAVLPFTDKQASLTVTAEDGKTGQTYTIALQNTDLALSALTLTIAGVAIEAKIVGTSVYVGVADKTAVSAVTIQQITVGDGATASPAQGEPLTFTASNGEQTATITVEKGGKTETYAVELQNTTRQITSFVFMATQNGEGGLTADIIGDITNSRGDADTITLEVPALESLSFVPTIDHNGERMAPATGEAQNFSTQVIYQVTSEYGELRTYRVTVRREDPVYTFELDGGTLEGENPLTLTSEVVPVLLSPTRAGYRFVGWFTDAGLTTAYKTSEPAVFSRTLYASWEALPQFTVSFEVNGGSAVAELEVTEGQKVARPADPTRTGYTFVGWYKEVATTNVFGFDTEEINKAITLYAKWEAQSVASDLLTLTLTLGSSQVLGVIEDTTVRFSVADKTLETATIASITLSAQATSEAKAEGTLTFTSATSSLTVTAEDGTTTQTYTLKLVSNQADLTNLSLTIAGATYPVTFPEGQTTTSLAVPDDAVGSATIQSLAVSAEASANPAEGSSLTFTDKQASLTVTAEDGKTSQTYTIALQNANLALSALTLTIAGVEIGAKIVGTVVYVGVADKTAVSAVRIQQITVGNGATASPANGESLPFTSSNGEQTATITVSQGGATADYTVKLQNTTRQITSFVFMAAENGGRGLTADITGVITDTTDTREDAGTITLKVPAVESLSFVPTIQHNGESVTPATGQVQDFSVQVTYQVTSEYGNSKTYTVTVTREDPVYTLELAGGAIAGDNPLTLASGSVPDLPAPTRGGYRFVGWFTDAGLTTAYEASELAVFSRTLYASWAEIPQFTVSFNSGEGSAVDSQQVEEGKEVAKPADPTRTGYTFGGWYQEVALTNIFDFVSATITADTTLYAKWEVLPVYSVRFDLNYDLAPENPVEQQVKEGQLATAPATPAQRITHKFLGWYRTADGGGEVFDFQTEKIIAPIMFYAGWEALPTVKVTFESIGEVWPPNFPREKEVVSGRLIEESAVGIFSVTHYVLLGLYTDVAGTVEFDRATSPITQDMTLHVRWEARPESKEKLQEMINAAIEKSGNEVNLNYINTSKITDMSALFQGSAFNGDISGWDVSSVTNMSNMFRNASAFAQDLEAWNIPLTVDKTDMFTGSGLSEDAQPSWYRPHVLFKETADETEIKSVYVLAGEKVIPSLETRENYVFLGWYEDKTGAGSAFDFTQGIVRDVTVYGLWEQATTYEVTFTHLGEVMPENPLLLSYVADGKPLDLRIFSVTHYVLLGLYTDAAGTEVFDTNEAITEARTLYVKWQARPRSKEKLQELIATAIAKSGNEVNLNYINTSQITDISELFQNKYEFNGDISGWDVSSVTNMSGMFHDASAFTGDISGWNVSNVTNMSFMFNFDTAFKSDLSGWDVSSVTNMRNMFDDASAFTGDISKWNVSSVKNMNSMFRNAYAFTGDISQWNVSSVTNMGSMFATAFQFNSDLSGWDVSSVTDMNNMFVWNKVSEKDMKEMFVGNIGAWDVSGVTNMSNMFDRNTIFNEDISGWDVSSVTNMSFMFSRASAFTGDISGWDVSSVTNMDRMFREARAFNGDISAWNVSSVTGMSQMFLDASTFNQDLESWNVAETVNKLDMFVRSGVTTLPSWY